MTNGLLIRGASVQVRPSPPNDIESLSLGITPHTVSSDPSKNALNCAPPQRPSHSFVTVEKGPVPSSPPIVRPPRPVLRAEGPRTEVQDIIDRFVATIQVRRSELLGLRDKLMEQVGAIDAALEAGPAPPRVEARQSPAPVKGLNLPNSIMVKALRDGRKTILQIAKATGCKASSVRTTMSKGERAGLVLKDGWGPRAHYRLADMGDR